MDDKRRETEQRVAALRHSMWRDGKHVSGTTTTTTNNNNNTNDNNNDKK